MSYARHIARARALESGESFLDELGVGADGNPLGGLYGAASEAGGPATGGNPLLTALAHGAGNLTGQSVDIGGNLPGYINTLLGWSGPSGGGGDGAGGGGDLLGSLMPLLGGLLGGGGSGGGGALGGEAIRNIVRELLSTVPPPIRDQVRQVINEVRSERGTLDDVGRRITSEVDSRVSPQVAEAVNALASAQTQTEATQEHRAIVRDNQRWTSNADGHRRILEKLDAISTRLGARNP